MSRHAVKRQNAHIQPACLIIFVARDRSLKDIGALTQGGPGDGGLKGSKVDTQGNGLRCWKTSHRNRSPMRNAGEPHRQRVERRTAVINRQYAISTNRRQASAGRQYQHTPFRKTKRHAAPPAGSLGFYEITCPGPSIRRLEFYEMPIGYRTLRSRDVIVGCVVRSWHRAWCRFRQKATGRWPSSPLGCPPQHGVKRRATVAQQRLRHSPASLGLCGAAPRGR